MINDIMTSWPEISWDDAQYHEVDYYVPNGEARPFLFHGTLKFSIKGFDQEGDSY